MFEVFEELATVSVVEEFEVLGGPWGEGGVERCDDPAREFCRCWLLSAKLLHWEPEELPWRELPELLRLFPSECCPREPSLRLVWRREPLRRSYWPRR